MNFNKTKTEKLQILHNFILQQRKVAIVMTDKDKASHTRSEIPYSKPSFLSFGRITNEQYP